MTGRRNGTRARCQYEACDKFAQTRGLCKAHGGGSRCRDESCHKLAQSRGLCIAHGGGRRCQEADCHKLAQSKGYCISHGGGRRCTVMGCEKFSQVKGRCKSHSKLAPFELEHSDSTTSTLGTDRSSTSSIDSRSSVSSKLRIDFLLSRNNQSSDERMSLEEEDEQEPPRRRNSERQRRPFDYVRSAFQRLPSISRDHRAKARSQQQAEEEFQFPVLRQPLYGFMGDNLSYSNQYAEPMEVVEEERPSGIRRSVRSFFDSRHSPRQSSPQTFFQFPMMSSLRSHKF